MSKNNKNALTAKELVEKLVAVGITKTEIARELRRSPRMVHKIVRGETSGHSYVSALEQLANTGHITTPPARRRNKRGKLVAVRAKGENPSYIPEDPANEKYQEQPTRGAFTSTTYYSGGNRQHNITLPKTPKTKGRLSGSKEILRNVRNLAKSQRWGKKRVQFQLVFANGRVMDVGSKSGYSVSEFLKESNKHGDALEYLKTQTVQRYENLDVNTQNITGITIKSFTAQKN